MAHETTPHDNRRWARSALMAAGIILHDYDPEDYAGKTNHLDFTALSLAAHLSLVAMGAIRAAAAAPSMRDTVAPLSRALEVVATIESFAYQETSDEVAGVLLAMARAILDAMPADIPREDLRPAIAELVSRELGTGAN